MGFGVAAPYKRPWQGKQENIVQVKRPEFDEKCYLCPGNTRANGETNPNYKSTYSFNNDFAALLTDTPTEIFENGLLKAKGEIGLCKVIGFSPNH